MPGEFRYILDRVEDILDGQRRMEEKLNLMHLEQTKQRSELDATKETIEEHSQIISLGYHGAKPLVVQVAEIDTQVDGLKSDFKALGVDEGSVRKQRLMNWGKILGIIGLVISQIFTWVSF